MGTQLPNKYNEYCKKAIDRIDSILGELGVEYRHNNNNTINIKCPIHQSEKINNSIIYLQDPYVWLCFSGNCHKDYSKSIIGFITGCLKISNQPHAISDIFNFIDGDHKVCPVEQLKTIEPELIRDESHLPEIIIPSKYYISRGFKPETLIKFGIGDCKTFPYKYRAIVPIRYICGGYMGFSGRSHYKKCVKCGFHHSQYESCIPKDHEYARMYSKWHHSKGLKKTRTLYGCNLIKNTNKVAIVEGPSCVWKLDEFNIPAVACLGKDFTKYQYEILLKCGISNVLFLNDNDEAGLDFRNRFVKDYHNKFNIYFCRFDEKDISEMSNENIKNSIVEKWNQI